MHRTQTLTTTNSDYLVDFAKSIYHENKHFLIAHINIRSLRSKVDEVKLLYIFAALILLPVQNPTCIGMSEIDG